MDSVKKLKDLRTLNLFISLWDLLMVIFYIVVFFVFFSLVKAPEHSYDLEYPEQTAVIIVQLFGRDISMATVNTVLTLSFVFMLAGAATCFINLRHKKGLLPREYHRWEAGTTIVSAFLSLLSLNIASFIARIYNANQICEYAEDVTLFGMIRNLSSERKERKRIKKEEREHEFTDDEKAIKKTVAKQNILKVSRSTLIYLTLTIFAIFMLVPFYWMILTAFKTYQETKAMIPSYIISIESFQWVNMKFIIENLQFGLYIKNTLIVAVLSTIGTVVTTILAAFAFARLEFKGREALFQVLLMTMMIPGEMYIITNFTTVSSGSGPGLSFGWIGNNGTAAGYFAAMIVPFMTSVFYIFLLRQTFKQIPDSLYKAAKVDGCSDFKYLTRVMIPIAFPTIITITILSILGSWNAYLWPNQISSVEPTVGEKYWLISVALRKARFNIDRPGAAIAEPMYNLQIGATALVTVPLLIIFMMFRKKIMSGVGRSGTKG